MIDVIQFSQRGTQHVADFGDGVELIWTPAIDPTDTLGIPPLKGAPHTPQIWIFPPTKNADTIIVNPIYTPDYKDFILVFPADSGVLALYIVLNVPGRNYVPKPKLLPGFPDAKWAHPKLQYKVAAVYGLDGRHKMALFLSGILSMALLKNIISAENI